VDDQEKTDGSEGMTASGNMRITPNRKKYAEKLPEK
jgi:hypothetical protein